MNIYYYIGCFVNRDELTRYANGVSSGHLCWEITIPHVTFVFEPDEVNLYFIEPFTLKGVFGGYMHDGTVDCGD